jgi:hypothetical protein
MKGFPLALIAISIGIICIFNVGLVSALEDENISITPSWSKATPSQGDSVTVTLRLTSTSSEQIRIYRVGLHFDWMAEGSFFTLDLTSDPVTVPSQGLQIFDSLAIQIPVDASIGSHSYYVAIDGAEAPYYESFSWDSSSFTVEILESGSKLYDAMLTQVDANISSAVNAGYQSSEAKSLLTQAQTERAEAVVLASSGDWDEAISKLQDAFSHLQQAEAAEQQAAGTGPLTLLLYGGIIAAVVVIVVVIVMVMRRKRKTPDEAVDQTDDQTFDEQTETQDYEPEE